jgi:hypothetical protein
VDINVGGLLDTTGANAYTQTAGVTTVNGTLTAATIANNGGTIQGTGRINGQVNNAATLAGGVYTSTQNGTLTINGGLTNKSAGTLQTLITGTGAGQTSVVNVAAGPLLLQGGTLNAATNGFSFAVGQSFTVATFAPGNLTGVFANLDSGTATGDGAYANLGGGVTLIANYNDNAGNITLQTVATPTSTADTWNGGVGTWNTASGWSAGVPLSYSTVTIGATSSGDVTLNQDATIDSLQVNNGNTLAYQSSSPASLTVGKSVTVNAGGALTLGRSGDKLSVGTTLTNDGTTTIGNGATVYALGAASNTGSSASLFLQGGSLTALSFSNTGLVKGFGTINPAISNGNLVEANGGTLVAEGGVQGTAGTVQIDSGATLDLSNSPTASSAAILTQNGSLKLGSQNITVSQDYTNANFGAGNSFNRRADVTGAGQILASGNVAQALGGNVTGGTTATPTMTFGNVHVGSSTTQDYTIENTGTSGPSLRGAIQTSVNGGNLTSAALSGAGVTASNWGPVQTSNATSDLGVTYAPTSAGALSGQAVHIANNFDNVASQTLSIAGAAYDYANPTIGSTQPINVGNYHVGATVTQQAVSLTNTTITNAAFQEGLNASIGGATTGVTTNGGSLTNLAAGSTDSSSLKVGISTATAGAISGTATLSLASTGVTTSGLGITALPSQTVSVTGGVYNLASSNTIAPIDIVAHTGQGIVSQALTITNTAPAGAFSEGLDSSFGAYTPSGGSTLTPGFAGSVTNLAAGSTDNSSMKVSVSTATAGTFSGTVVVDQESDGATTSHLGTTALPSQDVAVSGDVSVTVTNLAQATVNNTQPISFGNVRIGTTVANQAISVTNSAPVSKFTELLDGSVGSSPTGFTASGGFTGLAATSPPTSNTSITVGMDSSTAGAKSGNVVLNFVSDGTTISGDGTTTPLPSQDVAVAGAVYRLANPTLNTSSVTLAARVGEAAPTANVSVTNTSPDQYTESLKANFGTASSGFTNTGAINATPLVAGGTDSTSLSVGLSSTATSGTFSGTSTVNFVSTGEGTDGAADMSVGGKTVSLTGNVYQTAVASVTPSVDFGVVHVNQTVANQSVTVTNTATGALTDVIIGGYGTPAPGSPFTTSGNLGSGVAGNGGSSNALKVGLNTGTAGMYSGSAALALASHDSQLTDVALTADPVSLTAQVNNYAVAGFGKTSGSGSLTNPTGADYVLNFGTVSKGGSSLTSELYAANLAPSLYSDFLSGDFTVASGDGDFGLSGFDSFSSLRGQDQTGALGVTFDTSSSGLFKEVIDLVGQGSYNGASYSPYAVDAMLTIEGTVSGAGVVPEPSTWAMMGIGFAGLAGMAGWRRRASGRVAGSRAS